MKEKGEVWFELMLATEKMTVKTETLFYPLRSFIAEVGGALGLFLGFSFVMVVDGLETFILFIKHSICKIFY